MTTHYLGGYYERTINGATRRYYRLGEQLVLYDGTAYHYLYGDHLNSATLTTNAAGVKTSETRYFPYGAHRFDWGSDPSDRDFTGQRRDAEIALLDYVARRYSPYLGRFVSPDSIVPEPGNPQDLNRYAYVRNNPLRYTDPTGHCPHGDAGAECRKYLASVEKDYGVVINDSQGLWTLHGLKGLALGLHNLKASIPESVFAKVATGREFFVQADDRNNQMRSRMAHWSDDRISVGANLMAPDPANPQEPWSNMAYIVHNTAHEGAHAWDKLEKGRLSRDLVALTGGTAATAAIAYAPGGQPPTEYARTHEVEDWAESLTVSVYPVLGKLDFGRTMYTEVVRGNWNVSRVIREYGR
jgi:RHS repeat-associated protein